METKTKGKQEDPREEPRFGDFWTIEVRCDTYYVSAQTAVRVGALLERFWRPRWTRFVDLYGRRVWVRTDLVESVHESTEAQRSRHRAFDHARRKEEKADRRWDDDEDW
jgi:hypothetical protein